MASLTPAATPASIDAPDIGNAGRDLLSLALMDARNHTLHLLAQYEQALGDANFVVPRRTELSPPLWLAGHIGWFAEFWIGRNPQRGLGGACPVEAVRLASIEPRADNWFHPALVSHEARCSRSSKLLRCAPGCWRRWKARWSCWKKRRRPTRRCTSFAPRCSTRTCAASS